MRNLLLALLVALTACATSSTETSTSSAAIAGVAAPDTEVGVDAHTEVFDADGVAVTFHEPAPCDPSIASCADAVRISFVSLGGRRLDLVEDLAYTITHAEVDGIAIDGTSLDEVRASAAAIGLSVDAILDTATSYFLAANRELTTKEKIKCILKALGLGGKMTVATFACSACIVTLMGFELGPPAWVAELLTCGTCMRYTGKSLMGLYDLIKTCNKPPAKAAAMPAPLSDADAL